jgi:hypothetical protein
MVRDGLRSTYPAWLALQSPVAYRVAYRLGCFLAFWIRRRVFPNNAPSQFLPMWKRCPLPVVLAHRFDVLRTIFGDIIARADLALAKQAVSHFRVSIELSAELCDPALEACF